MPHRFATHTACALTQPKIAPSVQIDIQAVKAKLARHMDLIIDAVVHVMLPKYVQLACAHARVSCHDVHHGAQERQLPRSKQ